MYKTIFSKWSKNIYSPVYNLNICKDIIFGWSYFETYRKGQKWSLKEVASNMQESILSMFEWIMICEKQLQNVHLYFQTIDYAKRLTSSHEPTVF